MVHFRRFPGPGKSPVRQKSMVDLRDNGGHWDGMQQQQQQQQQRRLFHLSQQRQQQQQHHLGRFSGSHMGINHFGGSNPTRLVNPPPQRQMESAL